MATPATEAPSGATPKKTKTDWGKYGRNPVIILALVAFIDSVDRGILPGVLDDVQDDLGFSDFQAGFLGTAFVLAGFVAVLPAGYLADRYRRTRIIAIVLASWGAISALNAAVTSFVQFAIVRATLGIGETVDNPSSQSLIADYYRPDLRGRAYAYQRVAPTVGQAIGLGIGGIVGAVFGWRAAFLIVGVPGSILAFVVWRMKEPVRGEHDLLVEPDVPALATTRPEREAASVDSEPVAGEEESEVGATRAVWRDGRRILPCPHAALPHRGQRDHRRRALGHRVLGEDVLRAAHHAHLRSGIGRRGRTAPRRRGARHGARRHRDRPAPHPGRRARPW